MMKRDLIVFEHERFELTGYDVWMTAGEIASLFGVTVMKVRGIVNRMNKHLAVNMDLQNLQKILQILQKMLQNLQNLSFLAFFVRLSGGNSLSLQS